MISIKTATREHKPYLIEAMARLLEHVRDSSQDEYLLRLTDDYINESGQWLDNISASDHSVVFLAEANDIPVGYAIGTITRPFIQNCAIKEIGLLEHCWIEREWRLKGIATMLVKAIEDWFTENSINYIDVQYLLGNFEAENTWENLGYKPYRVIARKILK
jgi:GNAT superfamily N-acetyltransferase